MPTLAGVPSGSGVSPCCCEPAACCPYPWPDPDGTPLYPTTDLPATLALSGPFESATLSHVAGTYTYTGTASESGATFDLEAGAELWELYRTASGGSKVFVQNNGCLPGPYFGGLGANEYQVSDEFSDTLSLNGTSTLTRDLEASTCIWTDGTNDLDYGISNPYKFSLNGVAKTDPQSSPTGTYGGDTVS